MHSGIHKPASAHVRYLVYSLLYSLFMYKSCSSNKLQLGNSQLLYLGSNDYIFLALVIEQ